MCASRLAACALAIGIAATAAAQGPEEAPPLKKNEYAVTVVGCVKGTRLERAIVVSSSDGMPADALNASMFVLDGPKDLIKEIKDEHKDHQDRIAGIVVVPPALARAIATRKIGPISIGIGSRPDQMSVQNAAPPLKLKVSSIVHVQSGCAGR